MGEPVTVEEAIENYRTATINAVTADQEHDIAIALSKASYTRAYDTQIAQQKAAAQLLEVLREGIF